MAYPIMSRGFADQSSVLGYMVRYENKFWGTIVDTNISWYDDSNKHRSVVPLSRKATECLRALFFVLKWTFHLGFVPFVIYLGWTKGPDEGSPPFSFTNFLLFY